MSFRLGMSDRRSLDRRSRSFFRDRDTASEDKVRTTPLDSAQ